MNSSSKEKNPTFTEVAQHESAHYLVARSFGYKADDIEILSHTANSEKGYSGTSGSSKPLRGSCLPLFFLFPHIDSFLKRDANSISITERNQDEVETSTEDDRGSATAWLRRKNSTFIHSLGASVGKLLAFPGRGYKRVAGARLFSLLQK